MHFLTFMKTNSSALWITSTTFSLKKVNVWSLLFYDAKSYLSLQKMILPVVKDGGPTIWIRATAISHQIKGIIVTNKEVVNISVIEAVVLVTEIEAVIAEAIAVTEAEEVVTMTLETTKMMTTLTGEDQVEIMVAIAMRNHPTSSLKSSILAIEASEAETAAAIEVGSDKKIAVAFKEVLTNLIKLSLALKKVQTSRTLCL